MNNRIENYYHLYQNHIFSPNSWDWHIRRDSVLGKTFIYVMNGTSGLITRFACTSYESAIRICRLFGIYRITI